MNYDDFLEETNALDDAAIELARDDARSDPSAGEEPPEGHITPAVEQAVWDSATHHDGGVCDCDTAKWMAGEAPF